MTCSSVLTLRRLSDGCDARNHFDHVQPHHALRVRRAVLVSGFAGLIVLMLGVAAWLLGESGPWVQNTMLVGGGIGLAALAAITLRVAAWMQWQVHGTQAVEMAIAWLQSNQQIRVDGCADFSFSRDLVLAVALEAAPVPWEPRVKCCLVVSNQQDIACLEAFIGRDGLQTLDGSIRPERVSLAFGKIRHASKPAEWAPQLRAAQA